MIFPTLDCTVSDVKFQIEMPITMDQQDPHTKQIMLLGESGTATSNPGLFSDLPRSTASSEQFSELLRHPGLRIERIVSTGQCSPPDFWYEQDEGEWVAILQGEARLRFADEDTDRHLKAGDWLDIAPYRRHRVEWTPPEAITIWLAVFYAA